MTLQTLLAASDPRHDDDDEAPSPLPPPDAADRVPPPPFTGYVHLFDRPWATFDPPVVYQRDIIDASGTWNADVWEVEVRFVRPASPERTS